MDSEDVLLVLEKQRPRSCSWYEEVRDRLCWFNWVVPLMIERGWE